MIFGAALGTILLFCVLVFVDGVPDRVTLPLSGGVIAGEFSAVLAFGAG